MKYKLNLTKEQISHFIFFTIGLFVLFEIIFYESGFFNVLIISLKLSLLIHFSGYLIALKLFKEDFETIGLLFIGFAFGMITNAFFYYLLSSWFGVNINHITYIVPIFLIMIGVLINFNKTKELSVELTG